LLPSTRGFAMCSNLAGRDQACRVIAGSSMSISEVAPF